MHRSSSAVVPLIARRIVDTGHLTHVTEAREYDVALSRPDAQHETWLYIGEGPCEYLEIHLSDAAALVAAITAALEAAQPQDPPR